MWNKYTQRGEAYTIKKNHPGSVFLTTPTIPWIYINSYTEQGLLAV